MDSETTERLTPCWMEDGVAAAVMRGTLGYSYDDCWNGSAYLAGIIGSIAIMHRNLGAVPPFISYEEWTDILTRIAEPLLTYAHAASDKVITHQQTAAARDALRLFAEWFDWLRLTDADGYKKEP